MIDAGLILRFGFALALVLTLIAGAGWLGRRYMGTARLARLAGKHRRLALVETLTIDARTRLLLVRRDSTEHLIMLSATGAAVVESKIEAAQNFAQAVEATQHPSHHLTS